MLHAEQILKPSLSDIRMLIATGRYEDALIQLSAVVQQFADWAEPWVLVAQVMSLRCRYDEALAGTQRALVLEPDHSWAQQLQTGVLLQLDRHDEALISAERLVAISPHRPESFVFMAFAHAFAGNDLQALGAAHKAQRLSPNRGIGHQALCVVHLAKRRWDRAEQHAKLALAMEGPIASVFHDLGVAQFEQGKFDEARDSMVRAAALDQRFAGAVDRLAQRKPTGVSPIPVFIAVAAGIAAVPFGRMPIVFVVIACIGVASLLTAARQTGKSLTLHPDALRVALFAVLIVDLMAAAQRFAIFSH